MPCTRCGHFRASRHVLLFLAFKLLIATTRIEHKPALTNNYSAFSSRQGLEKYGVGKWREIITEYPELRRYDEQFIRIKTARLLGTQSLARHVGWRGNRAAVDAEYARHKALGERLKCWKGGVLVEDDHGSLAKAFNELGSAA